MRASLAYFFFTGLRQAKVIDGIQSCNILYNCFKRGVVSVDGYFRPRLVGEVDEAWKACCRGGAFLPCFLFWSFAGQLEAGVVLVRCY